MMSATHAAMAAHPVALALFGIAHRRGRGRTLFLPFGALRLTVGTMLVPFGLADAAVAVRVERSEALGLPRGARGLAVGGVALAGIGRAPWRVSVGQFV